MFLTEKKLFSLLFVSIFLVSILLISTSDDAFATSLENTELNAKSAEITLDIKFGQDEIKTGFFRTVEIAQLESIHLLFYGDEIILSEPKVKVTKNHFRISSIPEGIIMFGHKNIDRDNYDINLYFATSQGLAKFPLSTITTLPEDKVTEDKVTETEPIVTKQYVPELKITEGHHAGTYRGDTFYMSVQSFDGKINQNPEVDEFDGRLGGVDITVLISLRDEIVTTLKGITSNNGHWEGTHYFSLKSSSGEYGIDILASYGNQTVSKSTSMIVRSTTSSFANQSGNASPLSNAGPDQNQVSTNTVATLDGSGSSDSDGDTLTYSWLQTAGTTITLNDSTVVGPTFTTPGDTTGITLKLTVTDPDGLSSLDYVTITVCTLCL